MNKIKIAFIKFGGLSEGGTERWLQMMAANLPKDKFEVDYYYCNSAPYIGSNYIHPTTNPSRLEYMQKHEINLIKFHVGAKDITKPTHDWVDTDFWQVFNANKYDLIQTAKAGQAEYPYFLLKLPVVEMVALDSGVDFSSNIAWSILISNWQRNKWSQKGGCLKKSSIIPVPPFSKLTNENFRQELNIPNNAIVAGFHQRNDANIFSDIPLNAFSKIHDPSRFFVIAGGNKYRKQAQKLNLENVRVLSISGDNKKLSQFLNTLDIFAHGRKDGETFGTVFAEAMMHCLPCLSHWSPIANAQQETMGPGGLFSKSLNDYTNNLRDLYSNKALRNNLASKGKQHALEHYSLAKCVENLSRIYYKITNRKAPIQISIPIPYAKSPLGFLYAGHLEQPDQIAHHIITKKIPEEFDVHITRFFFPHISVLLDIGANTGLYGFIAAHENKHLSKIHCFEPQPDCCKQLKKTISLNNWEERVFVHQMGLGNKKNLPKQKIPVDTLDNQIKNLKLQSVDFIKIDVEGFEYQVLQGAKNTIINHKPVLFIKITERLDERCFINTSYKKTINFLQDNNYLILKTTITNRLVSHLSQKASGDVTHLCIHKKTHKKWIPELMAWAKRYHYLKRKSSAKKLIKKTLIATRNPLLAIKNLYSIFMEKGTM
jgi:hypothetical protein